MKSPCRNPCKECPYNVRNKHNDKFLENVQMLTDKNILESGEHTCHMIKTGWDGPTEKNICIGSISK